MLNCARAFLVATLNKHRMSKIANLLKSEAVIDTQTIWVEFKAGLQFKLRYLSRAKLVQIAQASQYMAFNDSSKTRESKIDTEKVGKELYKHIVVDWKNVTLRRLGQIMPLDLSHAADELDSPVTFSEEELLAVIEHATDLGEFLNEQAQNPALFHVELQPAATKN